MYLPTSATTVGYSTTFLQATSSVNGPLAVSPRDHVVLLVVTLPSGSITSRRATNSRPLLRVRNWISTVPGSSTFSSLTVTSMASSLVSSKTLAMSFPSCTFTVTL